MFENPQRVARVIHFFFFRSIKTMAPKAPPARRSSRLAAASSTPASPKRKAAATAPKSPAKKASKSLAWSESAGVGDRDGAWGIGGAAGFVLQYAGAFLLLTCCPAVVIYLYVKRGHLKGREAERIEREFGRRSFVVEQTISPTTLSHPPLREVSLPLFSPKLQNKKPQLARHHQVRRLPCALLLLGLQSRPQRYRSRLAHTFQQGSED